MLWAWLLSVRRALPQLCKALWGLKVIGPHAQVGQENPVFSGVAVGGSGPFGGPSSRAGVCPQSSSSWGYPSVSQPPPHLVRPTACLEEFSYL